MHASQETLEKMKEQLRQRRGMESEKYPSAQETEWVAMTGTWPDRGTNLPDLFIPKTGGTSQQPETTDALFTPPQGHNVDKGGTCEETQQTLHTNASYTRVVQWTPERRVRVCEVCGWPVQFHAQRMDPNTATAEHFRQETQRKLYPFLEEWERWSAKYGQAKEDPKYHLEALCERLKEDDVQPTVYLMYLFLVFELTPQDKAFLAETILTAVATGNAQTVVTAVNFVLAQKRDKHWLVGNGEHLFRLRHPLMPHAQFYPSLEHRIIGEAMHPTGGEVKKGFPQHFPHKESRSSDPKLVMGGAVHLPIGDNNGQWFADASCLEQPIQQLIQRVTALESSGARVNYRHLGEVIAAELRNNRASNSNRGRIQNAYRGGYSRDRRNVRGAGEEEATGTKEQRPNGPENLRDAIFGAQEKTVENFH